MEPGIQHFHSIWRYVTLILLLLAFARSLQGWMSKAEYTASDTKLGLFAMISLHIQLLTGLILYFLSDLVRFAEMGEVMKNSLLRFWTVEHISMMIVAVVLVTIGRGKAVKAVDSLTKHKKIAIFFGIGLLLIFLSIPWPWSNNPRPFFNF